VLECLPAAASLPPAGLLPAQHVVAPQLPLSELSAAQAGPGRKNKGASSAAARSAGQQLSEPHLRSRSTPILRMRGPKVMFSATVICLNSA
jgi:hypothetical protein